MSDHASLRRALRLNAGFSTTSAAVMLFAHDTLAEVMGLSIWLLIGTAVALLLFAVQLIVTSRYSDTAKLRLEGLICSLADFGWVLGTGVVIAMGIVTSAGNQILVAVAIPVLALGVAQWRGLPTAENAAASAS